MAGTSEKLWIPSLTVEDDSMERDSRLGVALGLALFVCKPFGSVMGKRAFPRRSPC